MYANFFSFFFKCATKQVHTRLFSTSSSQWKAMRRFNALDIERRCMWLEGSNGSGYD